MNESSHMGNFSSRNSMASGTFSSPPFSRLWEGKCVTWTSAALAYYPLSFAAYENTEQSKTFGARAGRASMNTAWLLCLCSSLLWCHCGTAPWSVTCHCTLSVLCPGLELWSIPETKSGPLFPNAFFNLSLSWSAQAAVTKMP